MPRFDREPAELEQYRPDVAEPADFDAFWSSTITESRSLRRTTTITRMESVLRTVDTFDVEFSGFGGDRIRAWLLVPAGARGPLPTVVEYVGYGGGRGLPHERLGWSTAGYAHLVMDTRGQGSVWGGGGETPDPHGSDPAFPGFMTRGIMRPTDYYYRRVFTDAVLAIDAVRELPQVDATRVAVVGGSQGGGIVLAAAALSEGLVAAMPEVPFLCQFEHAVGMTNDGPYAEIASYLRVHRGRERAVFDTLSYFDGVAMARRASAPAMFCVALMDTVTPPSTIYAAFNHYAGPKEIVVYPFNEHEGGAPFHWPVLAQFLGAVIV